ncbi:MAG: hypothetical protein SFY66_04260 [Oculatellaceae cyanobacterium bins.114]|nr:hypothetical protein [Oculatellaceae cyanobacterium bins.114]
MPIPQHFSLFDTIIFTPLVVGLEKVTAPFVGGQRRPITNEIEIQLLARLGHQEGVIEEDEFEMIQQVFRLNDVTARDMMTPRVAITYLYGKATLVEAKADIVFSQHSRMIVVEESLDEVLGIALRSELLIGLIQEHEGQTVASLTRPAHFIPESLRTGKLLKTFQAAREHLAVVVDEYGVSIDLQEITRRRGIRILRRGNDMEGTV